MKSLRSLSLLLTLTGALALSGAAFAHEGHDKDAAATKSATGQLVAPTEKDAAWVADQKAKYPTTMCVVSDDKLGGDMGKPVDYIYRVAGKPDRLVTFCCKDCVKDFNKDPDKYLSILDKGGKKAGDKAADDHAKHH
jgi:hypothetical protein